MKDRARSHSASRALPFGEPERPTNVYTAHVDGAARGNPGPASYAAIIRGPDGATVFQIGKYIGRTTNNVAEYYGLIAALDYAAANGIERLRVISDSELMVKQIQGYYKVKSPDLRPLHERAQKLARSLAFFRIEHVRREGNADADALANVALDRTSSSSFTSAGAAGSGGAARPAAPPSAALATPAESSRSSPKIAMTPHMRTVSSNSSRDGSDPQEKSGDRTVKARYSNGALHPLGSLDIADGEIVEIRIRRK